MARSEKPAPGAVTFGRRCRGARRGRAGPEQRGWAARGPGLAAAGLKRTPHRQPLRRARLQLRPLGTPTRGGPPSPARQPGKQRRGAAPRRARPALPAQGRAHRPRRGSAHVQGPLPAFVRGRAARLPRNAPAGSPGCPCPAEGRVYPARGAGGAPAAPCSNAALGLPRRRPP